MEVAATSAAPLEPMRVPPEPMPVPAGPAPEPMPAFLPSPSVEPEPAVMTAPEPSVVPMPDPLPAPLAPSESDGGERAYEEACRLQDEGDRWRAEQAFARAAQAGHRLAALSLGQLTQARGEVDEAITAYRLVAQQADSLGATACLSLGVLLDGRGDLAGAAAAYRRAAYTGGPAGQSAALLLRWLQSRDQRAAA